METQQQLTPRQLATLPVTGFKLELEPGSGQKFLTIAGADWYHLDEGAITFYAGAQGMGVHRPVRSFAPGRWISVEPIYGELEDVDAGHKGRRDPLGT